MDRQAWIAVTLCVIGFVALQIYNAKNMPPAPVPAVASPTPAAAAENQTATASPAPLVSPSPGALPTSSPAASIAPFAEKVETLRNDDVELHLTNRGGGIAQARFFHHIEAKGRGEIILN